MIGTIVAASAVVVLGVSLVRKPAPVSLPVTTASPVAITVAHLPLPAETRGVYATASTASLFSRYAALVDAVKAKGVNAIVLDVKGEDGSLAFAPVSKTLAAEAPVHNLMPDLDKIVATTHEKGLYLIARVPVFEDPAFAHRQPELALHLANGALWKDAKGLAWLDPAAEPVWKYNADIAREVYARGFDEVQFDYVRFATDGKTGQIVYPLYAPKRETMRGTIGRFFAYLDTQLRSAGIPVSVDVFGFTTWHTTDLGIGQWYADALTHFDFVSPMVYPSHYPAGTLSFKNPADHPYAIVSDSLKKGGEVVASFAASGPKPGQQRPWIQAFNLGAIYTPAMVLDQVRAAREAHAQGFLLWNAANKYSTLPDLRP